MLVKKFFNISFFVGFVSGEENGKNGFLEKIENSYRY